MVHHASSVLIMEPNNKKFLFDIHQDLRNSADMGDPLTRANPDHEVSKKFIIIAEKIKQSLK